MPRPVPDAATNDGQTFFPHTVRLFEDYPEVRPWIGTALYDAAYCDQGLKDRFQEELNIILMTSSIPAEKRMLRKISPAAWKR